MNLAHYLSSGIIAPVNYIENRYQDLQNKYINNILLCTSKFTDETNCSIEIVLNEREELPKKISENFSLFNMPLPISRIKSIYFNDEKQKANTSHDISIGAAFIPKKLLITSEDKPISTKEIENVSNKRTETDWKDGLKKFDQILGGFALMKIGKEDFQNYPTHFFKALGNINKFFDQILVDQNIQIGNTFQLAFTNEGNFKDFHDTIYSDVTNEVVLKYAFSENIKIETRNGLIQLDKIPGNTKTYMVSILNNYGTNKRKKADSFISDLISGSFNEKRKEGLSLIFGINQGYSSFRNKYSTINFEASIKFKLDSKVDYYIIESIYQNVFNDQNYSMTYPFIDYWCNPTIEEGIDKSKFDTYQVLDKTVIYKKKEDFFLELFRTSSERRNRLFEIISRNISKYLPKFLSLDTNLLKEQLQAEYEQFFKEYSQFIVSETQKISALEYENESNRFNNKIAILTSQLETQKSKIETLQKNLDDLNLSLSSPINPYQKKENELIENESIEIKEEENLKPESGNTQIHDNQIDSKISDDKEGLDEKTEKNPNQSLDESFESEAKDFSNQSFPETLFSEDSFQDKRTIREKELVSLTLPDLRVIAKNLNLKNISKKAKGPLIANILKNEF